MRILRGVNQGGESLQGSTWAEAPEHADSALCNFTSCFGRLHRLQRPFSGPRNAIYGSLYLTGYPSIQCYDRVSSGVRPSCCPSIL